MVFLLDGLGDNQNPHLKGKTALEVANVPVMDSLAKSGLCGLHDPVQPGLACGSDTAHMSIFGYNPLDLYNGRGAFEAMGSGLTMEPNYDIAFKCNFAYLNEETMIVERRRVDREFNKWGLELCTVLDNMQIPGYPDYKVSCEYATEHRCGLKVSGPGLNYHITGQDPLVDNRPLPKVEPTLKDDPRSKFTADLVQVLSDAIRKVLGEHPINVERKAKGLAYTNFLTLRGCG